MNLSSLINWLLPDLSLYDYRRHGDGRPITIPAPDPLLLKAASGTNGCRRAQRAVEARMKAALERDVAAQRELGIPEVRV
jgi:hypothetical protein